LIPIFVTLLGTEYVIFFDANYTAFGRSGQDVLEGLTSELSHPGKVDRIGQSPVGCPQLALQGLGQG
jgi:hypothetical protein